MRPLILVALVLASGGRLWGFQIQDPGVPGIDRLATRGFDDLYNLDYEEATRVFEQIIEEFPEDPAGYCYLSSTVWLKFLNDRRELEVGLFTSSSYFSRKVKSPVDAETEAEFNRLVNLGIVKANAVLTDRPDDVRATYYLGVAYGNMAAFYATVKRSLWKAFRTGSKAYKLNKKVLELDPEFYDAYLAIGLYDYVAGSIPWSFKWFTSIIGYRGNKERGLKELQLAATKGRYNANDSKIISMVLLLREKRFEEALSNLLPLQKQYYRNHLLHSDLVEIQLLSKRFTEAARSCREILARMKQHRPHYDMMKKSHVYLQLGNALLGDHQLVGAREAFDEALAAAEGRPHDLTLAYLRMGQVSDLLQRRSEAVLHYKQVMSLPNYQNSRKQAKRYIKIPYHF